MKNASARSSSFRKAYTLVELLVVIGIIAVLASLTFSVARVVVLNGHKLETKVVLSDVELAVNQFFTEYHRMPVTGQTEEPIRMNQGTDLLSVLLGDVSGPKSLNPAGRVFLQARPARNGRNGVLEPGGMPPSLVDRWGNPFLIVMDLNQDGRVPNPDTLNEDANLARQAPPHLRQRVAVFSAGPDGKQATRDDIVSWR